MAYMVALKTPEAILNFGWESPPEEAILALGKPVPLTEDPITFNLATKALESKFGRQCQFPWNWKHGIFLDRLVGEEGFSARLRTLPYSKREGAVLPAHIKRLFIINAAFPPTFFAHDNYTVFLRESTWRLRVSCKLCQGRATACC
ncbi:hypothetical protein FIBSPDRAFT_192363 [Athelia psychrophila]|uniref:Uncharacterized protein n=1 Tax=Athelia psychrophila TaxID=1759441 RepID=A0A167SHE8_9AGAM|nr:hypothetical protein FIBSPDRAFT_192363 [Fibularhizoctonia sp. CBS 109695]